MSNNSLNTFLEQLYQALRSDKLVLPTLPDMALRVRDVVSDENSSLSDVARIINKDPALAARLIQLANSPLLKSRVAIESVDMAVMRMGASMVKNIVTAMVMEQLFQATNDLTDRKLRACWQHASEVSSIAVGISLQYTHYQADQAMLAGLVHDIGMLPILTMAEDFPELLKDEAKLDELIKRAHPFVGQAILKHWNFPEALSIVPREHENLMYDSSDKPDYVDLIIVANLQSEKNHGRMPRDLNTIPAFRKLGLTEGFEVIDMEFMTAVGA
jgi:HD-like signal output (HDOD) protein